ncbi:hypothetical protein [Nocardia sp. NPDC050175]|uniref:NACHT N-terminal Helical domain 1-containing protein n=1 Tax=Nocardia sp. NPDC050175 TaxID=3364317 RepID=UPI00378784FE
MAQITTTGHAPTHVYAKSALSLGISTRSRALKSVPIPRQGADFKGWASIVRTLLGATRGDRTVLALRQGKHECGTRCGQARYRAGRSGRASPVGEAAGEQERRSDMAGLIRRYIPGVRPQRSVKRQFEQIADAVAESIGLGTIAAEYDLGSVVEHELDSLRLSGRGAPTALVSARCAPRLEHLTLTDCDLTAALPALISAVPGLRSLYPQFVELPDDLTHCRPASAGEDSVARVHRTGKRPDQCGIYPPARFATAIGRQRRRRHANRRGDSIDYRHCVRSDPSRVIRRRHTTTP